jgi:hypothetical protein
MAELQEPEKANELKTISIEKNVWILELPVEVCSRQGLAEGTTVKLVFKNGEVKPSFARPAKTKKRRPKNYE